MDLDFRDADGDRLQVKPAIDSSEAAENASNHLVTSALGHYLDDDKVDEVVIALYENMGIDAPPVPHYVESVEEARSFAKGYALAAQRMLAREKEEVVRKEAEDAEIKRFYKEALGLTVNHVVPCNREVYEKAKAYDFPGEKREPCVITYEDRAHADKDIVWQAQEVMGHRAIFRHNGATWIFEGSNGSTVYPSKTLEHLDQKYFPLIEVI